MKKIFITRPMPETVLIKARTLGNVTTRTKTIPLNEQEMLSALQDYDVVLPTLGDLFSNSIFDKVQHPRCKLLANFGVGYNHIDVNAARVNGILVTNTPGAVTDATADIAMTLMLMTARRAGEGERLVRNKKWEGWHPTQLLGLHISEKTVAIIGMGRIGQAIARRCHFGFGMQIVYKSRSKKILDFSATSFDTIAEVVAHADIVVVAVPGGSVTKHLINKQVFLAMQRHAIFVNIARGDVVDEVALIEALQTGQIGGAGLDVYEFEPEIPEALLKMENVTLFPHLGTASLEVRTQMAEMALGNIKEFIQGQTPSNLL
jgi:lactate dehydrogenase-like 2-hydroxyacid dehydrogenase